MKQEINNITTLDFTIANSNAITTKAMFSFHISINTTTTSTTSTPWWGTDDI